MASEIEFLLAEAALRGWQGAGSAKEHYEDGVRQSFGEWDAIGADEYLENDTDIPIAKAMASAPDNSIHTWFGSLSWRYR